MLFQPAVFNISKFRIFLFKFVHLYQNNSFQEVAYVFDDLLISYPPRSNPVDAIIPHASTWLKAQFDPPNSYRYDATAPESASVSHRFEHSAILSERYGTLHIWDGQFQKTSDVGGMWAINVAGKDSTVVFATADSDGINDDYEATMITALHTVVLMMIFMSMSLTFLLGLTQRNNHGVAHQNTDHLHDEYIEDDVDEDARHPHAAAHLAAGDVVDVGDGRSVALPAPVRRRGRNRGLHPEIIGTLPQQIYRKQADMKDEDGSGDEREKQQDNNDGEDCCPICLAEYEDGDELRVLPCEHAMHKTCLDAWLSSNPSCPSCRHSLHDLVDDSATSIGRPMLQLRTLRSRLGGRSSFAQFLSNRDAGVLIPSPLRRQYSRGQSRDEEGGRNGGAEEGGRDTGEGGIKMVAGFRSDASAGQGGAATSFHLRYVSSLVLTEEDGAEGGGDGVVQNSTAVAERRHSSARSSGSSNRRSQRERDGATDAPTRMGGIRRHVRGIRRGDSQRRWQHHCAVE